MTWSTVLDFILSKRFIQGVKVTHVFCWAAWMAGMFYLPRLFVYHVRSSAEVGSVLAVMERRLNRCIMHPAMALTVVTGLFLTYANNSWRYCWWNFKLLLVAGMVILNFLFVRHMGKLACGENRRSELYYRIVNEVPALLFILILIAVIMKPFKHLAC